MREGEGWGEGQSECSEVEAKDRNRRYERSSGRGERTKEWGRKEKKDRYQLMWRMRERGKEGRKMDRERGMRDGETWLICFCFLAAARLQDFLDQPTVEVNFSPACLPSLPLFLHLSLALSPFSLVLPPLPCHWAMSNGLNSYFFSDAFVISDYTPISSVCGTCLSSYTYMPLHCHCIPCFYS